MIDNKNKRHLVLLYKAYYTRRESTALAWTEAVTKCGAADEIYDEAKKSSVII